MPKKILTAKKQTWAEEELYFDGDTYFDALIKSIDEARLSVSLEVYIFALDPIGEEIEAALKRAARRSLSVRLLVDGIGARAWIEKRALDLVKHGVEVHVYHPVMFTRLFSWTKISKLNRRTHRKMCMIDQEMAFVGSLNISASHSARSHGKKAWRDTGVRVKGQAVRDLATAFEHAWLRGHTLGGERRWVEALLSSPLARPRSPLVRLNYTARLRRRLSREFLMRLRRAERRVWITNAYLAPSRPVMRQLKRAAARGIDVRLLLPRESDVFFMPWVAVAHYAPLMLSGARIFEYLPRFLHAKSVIIDDWAALGTSNMNRRSLFHDLEVDIVLTHPESNQNLEKQFELDLAEAEEVSSPPAGLSARLGRVILYLFRRWI
jgi:cardiolipin synthase